MIEVLISFIVICIVLGLVYWLVLQLSIPEPFAGLIKVAVVFICILLLLGLLFGGLHMPVIRFR